MSTQNWQTLDAIGSFGALVVAVATAIFAVVQWRRSERYRITDQRQIRHEAMQAQARKIVAWLSWEDLDDSEDPPLQYFATVTNRSDLPVFDVDILATERDGKINMFPIVWTLPPSEEVRIPFGSPRSSYDAEPRLVVRFYDAEGLQWQRNELGSIQLLDATPFGNK